MLSSCLVPNRAMTASPIRQTMIQVATTTAGPWSLAVISPCGGYEPPLPLNIKWSGRLDSDIVAGDVEGSACELFSSVYCSTSAVSFVSPNRQQRTEWNSDANSLKCPRCPCYEHPGLPGSSYHGVSDVPRAKWRAVGSFGYPTAHTCLIPVAKETPTYMR